MKIIENRRGSVTIFVMLFFVTLTGMIFTFISVSKKTAVNSSADALGSLWGSSILAEYDLNLQKRYNLFGFYAMPSDVTRKIDSYAYYSFKDKKYISYNGCSCSLFQYSLVNADVFKKQVIEVGKLSAAEKILKPEGVIIHEGESQGGIIRNDVILSGLPSKGSPKAISPSGIANTLKSAPSIKEVIGKTGDSFFESQYLFSYFKDGRNGRDLGKTFFSNEIEYVICGKASDKKNLSSVRNKIIAVREVLNFLFLNKSPVKSAEAMAAAEILTPGPAALATQKALLAAWALAESINDYQLLMEGHKVPVMKSEAAWAIDLDAVIKKQSGRAVYTGIEEGEEYEDYLKLFVFAMDEDVRLLRMMDLIQINMKYGYYRDFQLRDYNGGLCLTMDVNGESHEITKEY